MRQQIQKFRDPFLASFLCLMILGCNESGFQRKEVKRDASSANQEVPQPPVSSIPVQVATPLPTPNPKPCNAETIVFAYHGTEVKKCPEHYAAYTIDDPTSRNKSAVYLGCCPLPTFDILEGKSTERSAGCDENEVATGSAGPDQFFCTKINTDRYELSAPATTCYNGNGASGGNGSSGCGGPPDTLTALTSKFGKDACIGFPYGSLITYKTPGNKNCGGMQARQLFFKGTQDPVPMFPEPSR